MEKMMYIITVERPLQHKKDKRVYFNASSGVEALARLTAYLKSRHEPGRVTLTDSEGRLINEQIVT